MPNKLNPSSLTLRAGSYEPAVREQTSLLHAYQKFLLCFSLTTGPAYGKPFTNKHDQVKLSLSSARAEYELICRMKRSNEALRIGKLVDRLAMVYTS